MNEDLFESESKLFLFGLLINVIPVQSSSDYLKILDLLTSELLGL